jgi:hypothetical protein
MQDLPFVYEGHAASSPLPNTMGLVLRTATDQAAVSSPENAIVTATGMCFCVYIFVCVCLC